MCCAVSLPAAEPVDLSELHPTTLRALSDAGYVDAAAYRERARALGVVVSSTVVPVRQPLPSMAMQPRRPLPQKMGFV